MQVLDHTIVDEEEDIGVYYTEEPTFKQIMDEVDRQAKAAQETPASLYDTKSYIKFVKSFQVTQNIQTKVDHTNDVEITFIGSGPIATEIDPMDTDTNLKSMQDDNLKHVSGFDTVHSDADDLEVSYSEHISLEDAADNKNAFADVASLLDPLGHLQKEFAILSSKVDQLESTISKQVFEELRSFMPSLVSDALKETLPGLLVDALKSTLRSVIKECV
ncbi:hypothetical protein Tco_0715330 [Tanacetum coccineum]